MTPLSSGDGVSPVSAVNEALHSQRPGEGLVQQRLLQGRQRDGALWDRIDLDDRLVAGRRRLVLSRGNGVRWGSAVNEVPTHSAPAKAWCSSAFFKAASAASFRS